MKFKDIWNSTKNFAIKKSPEIFLGIGIAGMGTAIVLAVKATPKACKLIEEKKKELKVDKLTKKEVIKTTWKCYIPTAVTFVISGGLIISSNSIHHKRNAALAAAYSVTDTAFKNYQEKVTDVIGKEKEKKIREKIVEDQVSENPYLGFESPCSKGGNTLFFEPYSGRYFRCDEATINNAITSLNARLFSDMYVSKNDYYDEIGLETVSGGDDVFWDINKDGPIEIDYSTVHTAPNGNHCIAISFYIGPRHIRELY